jgi:hypothetical protein
MSETNYTPGPMSYSAKLSGSENHKGFWITDSTGWRIAEVMPIDPDGVEGEKITRLMTAAPELLKALKDLFDNAYPPSYMDATPHDDYEAAIRQSRAAIAKAEGHE